MIKVIDNTDPSKGETTLNQNPNLVHVCIPTHEPEWFDFRYGGIEGIYDIGIGASEVAKFIGTESEEYRPVLPELYLMKAGIKQPERSLNEATLSGLLAEDSILERWEYWDNTPNGYINNYLLGKKLRKHKKVNAYIYNKRFPWLFVSLDSSILAGQSTLHGNVLEYACPLELKTMNYMVKKNSLEETMVKYYIQATTQMLVTETTYAEICVLTGGSKFDVYHFDFDPELAKDILEKTYNAYEVMLQIRELHRSKAGKTQKQVEGIESQIQSLLPLPVSGDGYNSFYSEQYENIGEPTSTIEGTEFQYGLVKTRALYAKLSTKLAEKADLIGNQFRSIFVARQCNVIDFGELGSVVYKKKSNGTNYYPDFAKIKEKADVNDVEPIVKMIVNQVEN
jgi:hypothetical protein